MDFATDIEIQWAHDLLLPDKPEFDAEKMAIIKDDGSIYVQACPGSGKTTTLLVKLAILANRMPLPKGQGICVLTHTNVAMDEIKSKLGGMADVLFQYPNFFGTFQTFVHQFLTNQAIWHYYGCGIEIVDDEVASKRFVGKYYEKTSKSELETAKCYIHRRSAALKLTEKEYLSNISFDLLKNKVIYGSKEICGFNSQTGNELFALKEELYKEGVLSYNDAYQLGLKFIKENNFHVSNISSSRFKYVFVDEMQDMNLLQAMLLKNVFSEGETVIQQFGDHNQSIFSDNSGLIREVIPGNLKYINQSLRFGNNIATVVRQFCPEVLVELKGNEQISSSVPILMVFDNPDSVLPAFVNLLNNEKIVGTDISIAEYARQLQNADSLHRNNIKAIGWIKEGNLTARKLGVSSYYPSYKYGNSKADKHFLDYLKNTSNMSPSDCGKEITKGILYLFELNQIKTESKRLFTVTSFEQMLEEHDLLLEYRKNLMIWIKEKKNCDSDEDFQVLQQKIVDFLNEVLCSMKKSPINPNTSFLLIQSSVNNTVKHQDNIYCKDDVEIEVSNVHSIKGETHVATLYMETSYHSKCESNWLKNLFENNRTEKPLSSYALDASKVVFVGLSRATHFLCYAITRDNYSRLKEVEIRKKWRVFDIAQGLFV